MLAYQFTIQVENRQELLFIEQLLERLQLKIVSVSVQPSQTQKAISALQNIARRGVLASQIPNPVRWQQEIRQDRHLPFRES